MTNPTDTNNEALIDILEPHYWNMGFKQGKEAAFQVEVMYLSDIARAVGLLQGLGHPDEYLKKRLAQLKASNKQGEGE